MNRFTITGPLEAFANLNIGSLKAIYKHPPTDHDKSFVSRLTLDCLRLEQEGICYLAITGKSRDVQVLNCTIELQKFDKLYRAGNWQQYLVA